jgi:small subunit ribosomal protein S16
MGKKKQPIYKIVAADARSPRDGKFIEAVGVYNPLTNPHSIELNEERALYWLGVGAEPTSTVKSLLSQKGVILKMELTKKGLSTEQVNAEMEKWAGNKSAKIVVKKQAKPVVAAAEEKAKVENPEIQSSTPEVTGAASDEKPVE